MQLSDIVISVIADLLVVPIVLIGAWAMVRLPKPVWHQRMTRGLMTGLTALLLAKIISLFYQGERPFVETGVQAKAAYLNNPGFPSDHTLLVFTITLVLWASTKNTTLCVVLLVLSAAVACGRVLALVHTPIDVIGGIACAVLAAFIWYGKQLVKRNLPAGKSF